MSDIVIRVENLSKRYRIGQRERYTTLRDALVRTFTTPLRWLQRRKTDNKTTGLPDPNPVARSPIVCSPVVPSPDDQWIWALQDVSFEVRQGEVVGIIGRNGAGKSTLLKILARITEPTAGYAEVRGRVGSLLEVGTGFHPELTGRENIYLSGAVLGMKKREIDRKFDEIVAFAEMEKFIDTPVKYYSSGMYVRLAFAVAAHLEPEILLVDEVLAVGDAAFQKKCLGKMGDVAREGRTVLFVSHNMAAIENLCSYAILLENGCIVFSGDTHSTIHMYLQTIQSNIMSFNLLNITNRQGSGKIRFTHFYVEDFNGQKLSIIQTGQDVVFVFGFICEQNKTLNNIDFRFGIYTLIGERLINFRSSYVNQTFDSLPPLGEVCCIIPRFPLAPGRYIIRATIAVNEQIVDSVPDGVGFIDVIEGDFWGTGKIPKQKTLFLIDGKWFIR